jgi:hypothetical protein
MFTSAGRLEGMDEEEAAAQEQRLKDGAGKGKARAAFDEDTQANLYNRLQAAQRQGKRGMGKAAVKIAGGEARKRARVHDFFRFWQGQWSVLPHF